MGVSAEEEEMLEERYERVSKKKKYADLVARVRRDSRIEEDFELYPIVRKSVASFRINSLRPLSSTDEVHKSVTLAEGIQGEERIGPWHLLDVTPTQLEEIMDDWILERIAEENIQEAPIKKTKRVRNPIMKFVGKRFGEKVIKKRFGNDVVDPEVLPEREFVELREKFRQRADRVQRLQWERGVYVNESVISSHDLASQASNSNFIPEVRPAKSTSVEGSHPSEQSSEFSVRHLSSGVTTPEKVSMVLEERFTIRHVLSDFSLQKRVLVSDD